MANWLVCTALLAFVALASAADNRGTCAQDTRPCLDNDYAECDPNTDTCRCSTGYKGFGQLRCYPSNYKVCSILNDPQSIPYAGGKGVDIPLPCRYLASWVKVTVPEQNNLWCSTRVYAYGWRHRGKFFLRGYDIRLDWDSDTLDRYTLSLKAYGQFDANNNFQWDLLTRHSPFGANFRWQRDDINVTVLDNQLGGSNFFGVDAANNRVQFYSTVCGIDTAFRLFNNMATTQTDLPGLAIGFNPDAGNVEFFQVEGSACLNLQQTNKAAGDLVDSTVDTEQTNLYRLASANRGQAFPNGARDQCQAVEDQNNACTNAAYRKNALARCHFILAEPHFVNCQNPDVKTDSSIAGLEFYKQCMEAFCENSSSKCGTLKSDLTASGCQDKDGASDIRDLACSALLV